MMRNEAFEIQHSIESAERQDAMSREPMSIAKGRAEKAALTASLPKMHKGGAVKKDGAVLLKKGEKVLTAKQAASALALKAALSKAGLATAGKGAKKRAMK